MSFNHVNVVRAAQVPITTPNKAVVAKDNGGGLDIYIPTALHGDPTSTAVSKVIITAGELQSLTDVDSYAFIGSDCVIFTTDIITDLVTTDYLLAIQINNDVVTVYHTHPEGTAMVWGQIGAPRDLLTTPVVEERTPVIASVIGTGGYVYELREEVVNSVVSPLNGSFRRHTVVRAKDAIWVPVPSSVGDIRISISTEGVSLPIHVSRWFITNSDEVDKLPKDPNGNYVAITLREEGGNYIASIAVGNDYVTRYPLLTTGTPSNVNYIPSTGRVFIPARQLRRSANVSLDAESAVLSTKASEKDDDSHVWGSYSTVFNMNEGMSEISFSLTTETLGTTPLLAVTIGDEDVTDLSTEYHLLLKGKLSFLLDLDDNKVTCLNGAVPVVGTQVVPITTMTGSWLIRLAHSTIGMTAYLYKESVLVGRYGLPTVSTYSLARAQLQFWFRSLGADSAVHVTNLVAGFAVGREGKGSMILPGEEPPVTPPGAVASTPTVVQQGTAGVVTTTSAATHTVLANTAKKIYGLSANARGASFDMTLTSTGESTVLLSNDVTGANPFRSLKGNSEGVHHRWIKVAPGESLYVVSDVNVAIRISDLIF